MRNFSFLFIFFFLFIILLVFSFLVWEGICVGSHSEEREKGQWGMGQPQRTANQWRNFDERKGRGAGKQKPYFRFGITFPPYGEDGILYVRMHIWCTWQLIYIMDVWIKMIIIKIMTSSHYDYHLMAFTKKEFCSSSIYHYQSFKKKIIIIRHIFILSKTWRKYSLNIHEVMGLFCR